MEPREAIQDISVAIGFPVNYAFADGVVGSIRGQSDCDTFPFRLLRLGTETTGSAST